MLAPGPPDVNDSLHWYTKRFLLAAMQGGPFDARPGRGGQSAVVAGCFD